MGCFYSRDRPGRLCADSRPKATFVSCYQRRTNGGLPPRATKDMMVLKPFQGMHEWPRDCPRVAALAATLG
jgi:hypothetical protein